MDVIKLDRERFASKDDLEKVNSKFKTYAKKSSIVDLTKDV